MKTCFLNPFGQLAMSIVQGYGNINQISQKIDSINNIISFMSNQDPKVVDSIQELSYEMIRFYYYDLEAKRSNKFNYLFDDAVESFSVIATHTLIQSVAIVYGSSSYEADMIRQVILLLIRRRLEIKADDLIINETLDEFVNVNNLSIYEISDLIGGDYLKLDMLLIDEDKIILSYDNFIEYYEKYIDGRDKKKIFYSITRQARENLLLALIDKKIKEYMNTVESMLKQIEAADIIMEVGNDISQLLRNLKEEYINKKYGGRKISTSFNDNKPNLLVSQAFPPCIQNALRGTEEGKRNYTIVMLLTPFLSYARLYPGINTSQKQVSLIDFDPTLEITRTDILPLIYESADNSRPPLFTSQPEEKFNINNKLGFGDNLLKKSNANKSPWYKVPNCKSIQENQPTLCTPCEDCKKIGNPLTYYNRKRKLIARGRK